jgi:hypothetical protein
MNTKGYNCAVKVGSYTDSKTKEVKNKYVNVGAVFKDEKGNAYMLMNKTFNPAGVPDPENRESILISFFPVDNKDDNKDA